MAFDLKASVIGGNGALDFTADLTGNGYSPNDPTFILTTANATATVKWEVFKAGTNQTVALSGNAHISIGDIDGNSKNIYKFFI